MILSPCAILWRANAYPTTREQRIWVAIRCSCRWWPVEVPLDRRVRAQPLQAPLKGALSIGLCFETSTQTTSDGGQRTWQLTHEQAE